MANIFVSSFLTLWLFLGDDVENIDENYDARLGVALSYKAAKPSTNVENEMKMVFLNVSAMYMQLSRHSEPLKKNNEI